MPYPNSDGFEIPNYPIKPGGNRSGIYVYEEDKLIWESTNYIADISMGESTFQDLQQMITFLKLLLPILGEVMCPIVLQIYINGTKNSLFL